MCGKLQGKRCLHSPLEKSEKGDRNTDKTLQPPACEFKTDSAVFETLSTQPIATTSHFQSSRLSRC